MTLAPGTKLGPYEVVGPLGAGGMGEVYLAQDSRLGRNVAVKVLPQHLSANPEVRARFEREAKTISSLNHPNICTLFDVGREGGTDYLVMELIDGETLAEKLRKGPLPPAEVLKLGAQIADALDRAHRAGVIHRDLKPGNVMLTRSGAKLMDFGLARATGMAGPPGAGGATVVAMTQSPTMATALTAEGTLVGTFQYMSPEQLEGKEADARSDLWALGCVLYEMATSRRAFEGVSQASLIGAIMRDEPRAMAELAPLSPPGLERLVGALLAKDPDERVQTAHDARLQLQWAGAPASSTGAQIAATAGPNATRRGGATIAWGAAVVFAAIALVAFLMRPPAPGPVEFTLDPPAGYTFGQPADPALSPDGHTIACVVSDSSGVTAIGVRTLDHAEMRVLAGTTGAVLPFWAPNGHALGYFAQGKLLRMALDGTAPVPLADAPDARGGCWSKNGTILFAPNVSSSVQSVSASGGSATAVTQLDAARGEVGHRYPHMLSDGRRFLYIALDHRGKKWLCAGNLDGGRPRVLREAENVAIPATPGWILTAERRHVVARRFDERSLKIDDAVGEVTACGGVRKIGHADLACDDRGTLVYQQEPKRPAWLRWVDAAGHPLGERLCDMDTPLEAALSPDRKKVAFVTAADNALWVLDLGNPVATRLTFTTVTQFGALYTLSWSPDSKSIAYALEAGTIHDVIHVISTETSRDTVIFTAPGLFAVPTDWMPDGHSLIASCTDTSGTDLWRVPVDVPVAATRYASTLADENTARLSPDGKWVASYALADGKGTIQLLSWPQPGTRHQLTLDFEVSYSIPTWCEGGRSLVFPDARGRVIVVPVQLEGGFRQGAPRGLFTQGPWQSLVAASPDLTRFLIMESEPLANPAPLRVLTSWPARLRH